MGAAVDMVNEAGGDVPGGGTGLGSGEPVAGMPSLVAAKAEPVDEASYQHRLGQQLRAVRRAHGMRLQDVEDASDGRFKAVVIGSYERGDRAVSATKLAALADFYGVAVADLLPDERQTGERGREATVQIAVDRLRALDGEEATAPLLRLVSHVQWLRGDYNGRILSLRGDDLRTVGVALGLGPDQLGEWLRDRGLLAA
jgi:transcriptional regulator with XRE-family HTH domain